MQLTTPPPSLVPSDDRRAPRRRAGMRGRRYLAPATAALALVATACAQMPLREGPRAQLIKGIETPRDRNDMDITVYKVPVTAWPKCLEIVAEKNPILAVASALTLSVIHACAHVPRDRALKAGQRPWCIVAVPDGDDEALEHELRHCEGWDHPRSWGEAYANDDGQESGSEEAFNVTRNERPD